LYRRLHTYRVLVEKLRESLRHILEGSVISKRIFKKLGRDMDWIYVTKNRDRWVALVNAVMNLRAS
jgi:hypothetical protein